jgi:hypothetical protein
VRSPKHQCEARIARYNGLLPTQEPPQCRNPSVYQDKALGKYFCRKHDPTSLREATQRREEAQNTTMRDVVLRKDYQERIFLMERDLIDAARSLNMLRIREAVANLANLEREYRKRFPLSI